LEAEVSKPIFERQGADFTLKAYRYPANFVMTAHAHDEAGISVVLSGAVVEEAQHSSVTARAGWAVMKPASTVHTNRFGPAGATLLALVPRTGLDYPLPSRWTWVDRSSVFQSAVRLIRSRGTDGPEADADNLTDLVSSLADEQPGRADAAWLRKLKRMLDDPAEPPRSVTGLADDAAIHPVYLTRRFRAAFGVSIREYRKIAQVRRAMELVVGTRRPLSDIAHACGFADHSHMCRSFQLVAGINPRSLRF
jgi:AraC family transcriptional regulator